MRAMKKFKNFLNMTVSLHTIKKNLTTHEIMNLTKRGSKLRCSGCEKTKSLLYAIKGKILIIKTRT